MTLIFTPVFGTTKAELSTMIRSATAHTNALEFRADLSLPLVQSGVKLRKSLFPEGATVLLTNRSNHPIPEEEQAEFELLNVDTEDLSHSKIDPQKTVLAHHAFEPMSAEELQKTIQTMQKYPAAYYKIAAQTNTEDDLRTLIAEAFHLPRDRWLLMGMGPLGPVSRVAFSGLGFGTFACVSGGGVAPGQIEISTLTSLLP